MTIDWTAACLKGEGELVPGLVAVLCPGFVSRLCVLALCPSSVSYAKPSWEAKLHHDAALQSSTSSSAARPRVGCLAARAVTHSAFGLPLSSLGT